MRMICFVLLGVSALSPAFANTVAVIPCQSKPNADGSCPTPSGLTNGESAAIEKDDYYDVYIESTCIDQPDTWWHKKLVSFDVRFTVGNNSPISVPVFAERAEGSGCRIGVNGFPVMTSIPSNGQELTLQVSVMRSDASDGLRQLLSFATATSQDPSLNTYAAAAVPYMGLAVDIANTAYKAFGQSATPWLSTSATALHPEGVRPDRFDLRDGYLLQYSGPNNPEDNELYVDSGDVRWKENDSLLRGGSTWVLFKIEKYSRRKDYPTRAWYQDWEKLLDDALAGSVATDAFKNRYQQVITLLQNDPDFTSGDKRQYVESFTSIRDQIVTELSKPAPDFAAIIRAIDASQVQPLTAHQTINGRFVTAVNAKLPVVDKFSLNMKKVIVPGKLEVELKANLKP